MDPLQELDRIEARQRHPSNSVRVKKGDPVVDGVEHTSTDIVLGGRRWRVMFRFLSSHPCGSVGWFVFVERWAVRLRNFAKRLDIA